MPQTGTKQDDGRLDADAESTVHCLHCGEVIADDVDECPACGGPHIPTERFDLLTHRAALDSSTVEQLGLRVPPLAYRRVKSRRWLWVDLLTLNYLIVGGFLFVPFHASGMIDDARNELLDYKKEVLAEQDADELHCQSCGTRIRIDAENCPHCGEVNSIAEIGSDEFDIHDPDEYETDVSGRWWIALVIGTILLAPVPIWLGSINGAAGIVAYLAIAGALATSVYYDAQYVRANARWDPSTIGWSLGFAIPLLNVGVLVGYLWARRRGKAATH